MEKRLDPVAALDINVKFGRLDSQDVDPLKSCRSRDLEHGGMEPLFL